MVARIASEALSERPGKVEYEQAKKFAQAFLRGQPHKATIATTLFRDKIEKLRS
jgi:pyruvate dehydrogenase (quinone)